MGIGGAKEVLVAPTALIEAYWRFWVPTIPSMDFKPETSNIGYRDLFWLIDVRRGV